MWEPTEVRSVDVDDYLDRFGNMTIGQYSTESLKTYKSRFQKALGWYGNFLSEPGWTPPKSGIVRSAKPTAAGAVDPVPKFKPSVGAAPAPTAEPANQPRPRISLRTRFLFVLEKLLTFIYPLT